MSIVTLYTLWGQRKGEIEPELMEAWDYFSVDENREGFFKACDDAIKSWGDDLQAHRYIDIDVDLGAVRAAFAPITVQGVVSTAKD